MGTSRNRLIVRAVEQSLRDDTAWPAEFLHYLRNVRGDAIVVDRLAAVDRHEVWVPQPAWAEIAFGIARLPTSKRKTSLKERRVQK